VSSLECYKCSNNHNNWMDCTRDKVECKPFQDACTSFVSFHSKLFICLGEKWHNISKGCDTMERCEYRANVVNQPLCDRSSYNEWACVECCTGDLCNYFVTVSAS
ncbi:hypothetical protein HELRODRAFT_67587, partial [Helobdella robusta]|uniref:UPAR/Ly6 domain-containing protein n=1 Tax=Helobdella robusta TaxID=6412 RepID=T1FZ26_HELRO